MKQITLENRDFLTTLAQFPYALNGFALISLIGLRHMPVLGV